MSFLMEMALLVEHNHTWQMAAQSCLNASKLVYHFQGMFGKRQLFPPIFQQAEKMDCPEKSCGM